MRDMMHDTQYHYRGLHCRLELVPPSSIPAASSAAEMSVRLSDELSSRFATASAKARTSAHDMRTDLESAAVRSRLSSVLTPLPILNQADT